MLGVDPRVNQQAGGAVAERPLHDALTPQTPRASTPDGGNVAPVHPRATHQHSR
ncbi:MAG: hypothetical protein WDM96_17945 [Lacunisphaera sp.]